MSTEILARLDRLESDLRAAERELREIRATVVAGGESQPQPQREPPRPIGLPPRPQPAPTPPAATREPFVRLPRIDTAELLGARGLALAGGVVTLLGVVFFFVLAASNGWIGPLARVLLGGGASALVFAAGIAIHARYGNLYAAVAAVGAGIAGGYASLLAASAGYDLVPPAGALLLAAAIAGAGVALSLVWSSEIVASLGLIGAMVVPAVIHFGDTGITTLGTAFVALVVAGAGAVSVRERWSALLVAAGAASLSQIVVLVAREGEPARGRTIALAAVFVLLYLAIGVARQLRDGGPRLDSLASLLGGGAAALGGFGSFVLLSGDGRGVALLALGAVYAALAIAFWRGETLELAALLAAFGSALVAVATAQFLDGPALVVAWSAECVAVAWLGRQIGELRFQLVSIAYFALALVLTLDREARLEVLFERGRDYLDGVPALLALAAGATGYALLAGRWPAPRGLDATPKPLASLLAGVHRHRRTLRKLGFALGALAAVDAASLALLDLAGRLGVADAFGWGHVAVLGLWSAVALAALAAGLLRQSRTLEWSGVAALAATLVSFRFFMGPELPDQRGWAALVLVAALAATALLRGLLSARVEVIEPLAVATGALLSTFAAHELIGDGWGYGVLAAAGAHVLLAAAVFRRRNLSTCFWVAGLALGLGAAELLLEGTWLVLALAAGGAAIAWAGAALREPRLWVGATVTALFGILVTLGSLAPLTDLVSTNDEPAGGVPALLLVLGALVAIAFSLRPVELADSFDETIRDNVEPLRAAVAWGAPALGIYAASLSILAAAQWLSDAGVSTEFQRGHTAVSAFWGLVALGLLVWGLRRRARLLRLAGLGLFGLALAKLFLYDLATLSSVARAASFLAVGAVLLLAGFFYQRLSDAD